MYFTRFHSILDPKGMSRDFMNFVFSTQSGQTTYDWTLIIDMTGRDHAASIRNRNLLNLLAERVCVGRFGGDTYS